MTYVRVKPPFSSFFVFALCFACLRFVFFSVSGLSKKKTTQLLRYEGYDFAHPTLAAPLRPIVAHEVNLEAMRQAEVNTRGQVAGVQGMLQHYTDIFTA